MTTKERILKAIEEIPAEKLNELFSLVEDFKRRGVSVPVGRRWDRFFGILTKEQVETMRRVIDEEFERIEEE